VIDRESLVEMFESIADRGEWDMSQPMLWGYFFTNRNEAALRAAVPALNSDQYEFVDIYLSEKDDPSDEDLWWLHVQRVEVHTVDTLAARNDRLSEFASRHGIDSYDGMDVGPAPTVARPA
jgi:Regulator of ribonuclease activity B